MLQLKVVEGGLARNLFLDAPEGRPLRMKALNGSKYAVAIPVEGEPLATFPPGYVIKRVGNNLIVMKDGQEVLVLEGFFALQPIPAFSLEYDDELRLIVPENIDAYPTEGVLFDSFAADALADGVARAPEDDDKMAAWLLGLAGVAGAALGAALGGSGGSGSKGNRRPAVEGPSEQVLFAPDVLEMDGGAITAAEAVDGTLVQIAGYAGMQAGDTVALNWNGVVITHEVTAADVTAGHVLVTVPGHLVGPDGSFTTDYSVRGMDGTVLGKSPPATVVIDRVSPGQPGAGVDNPDTVPNENLVAPIIDEMGDGVISSTEAADGTVVRIPGYAAMEAGDIVRLNWNGATITHAVTADDLARGEVHITVPADRLGADGGFHVNYTVTDRNGNASGVSPSTPVELDRLIPGAPGSGIDNPNTPINENLAAPILDEMSEGVINAAEATDGTVVRIPAYANMETGDTIQLNWNGTVISHEVTASDLSRGEVHIQVPVNLLNDGSLQVAYSVTDRGGSASGLSASAPVVIDRTTPGAPGEGIDAPSTPINENLAAPIVDEMGDGVISSAEAANGTLVRIPAYANMEVGDTVRLNWNGAMITHTVTAADLARGEAHITVPTDRLGADGGFEVDYTVTDRSGNASGISPSTSVELDRLSPGAPGSGTDNPYTPINENLAAPILDEMSEGVINAAEASDGTVVRIPGYLNMAVGDTVHLNWNGTVIDYVVTAVDMANGEVQIPIDQVLLVGGSFSIDYSIADRHGNNSGVSPPATVVIDRVVPGAPGTAIDNPATPVNENLQAPVIDEMDGGAITAAEAADGTTVRIAHYPNMEAGDTIRLNWNGTAIAYVVTAADVTNGEARIPVGPALLVDGSFDIDYSVTDRNGNQSGVSPPASVLIDRLVPGAPGSAPDNPTTPINEALPPPAVDEMNNGAINDAEADDGTVVRIAHYPNMEAGDTIRLNWNGTAINYVVTAADVGSREVLISVDSALLAHDSFDIDYTVTDRNGNHSGVSPPTSVVIDRLVPGAPGTGQDVPGTPINEGLPPPVIDEMSGGAINAVEAADGTMVRIPYYLNMEAGDTIRLNWNGAPIDYVVTAADVVNGQVEIAVPAALMVDGSFNIDYTVTDRSGNTSGTSPSAAVKITHFAPPTIDTVSTDTGMHGDRITYDDTLTIEGSADQGALVVILVDGQQVGSVVADAGGKWTFTTPVLTEGDRKITAFQTDVAGNVSPMSPPYTMTIDTTVAAPIIELVGTDTGASSTDRTTNDSTLDITGKAEPGATVEVRINDTAVGTVIANGAGEWTFVTDDQTNGRKVISAVQTDVAGNVSLSSPPYAITVDTSVVAPTIESVGNDTGMAGDRITNDTTLDITGKAEPGATVYVTIDGSLVASVIADGNGTWTYTTSPLAEGVRVITATQIDLAGNVSAASPPYTMTIDTTPVSSSDLLAPVIAEMADGRINAAEAADGTVVRIPGYVGMAVGDTVTMNWNGTAFSHLVTAADVSTGHVLITVPPASIVNGSYTIDYTVADAAGNLSGTSPGAPVVVNLLPPPPSNQPVNGMGGDARHSQVAVLPDGGWVISWGSYVRNPTTLQYAATLHHQRFDVNGYAIGAPTSVDGAGHSFNDIKFELITLPNGGWAHIYRLSPMAPNGGSDYRSYIQKYTADGVKDGSRISLPHYEGGHIEALPSGDLIFVGGGMLFKIDAAGNEVWRATGFGPGTFEVLANGGVVYASAGTGGRAALRFVNADGSAGAEVIVSLGTTNANYSPQVETLTGGGYVVAWVEGTSTYQRQYLADGSPVGGPNLVKIGRYASDVEPLQDGGWVIAFVDSAHRSAYMQRFDSSGVAVGSETLISSSANWISLPDIAIMADGGYMVTWSKSDGGSSSTAFQQRYDSSGNKVSLDGSAITTLMTLEVESFAVVGDLSVDGPHGQQDPTEVVAQTPVGNPMTATSPQELLVEQLLGSAVDTPPTAFAPEAAEQTEVASAVGSDKQLVEQVFAEISACEARELPPTEHDAVVLVEAMTEKEADNLDALLDGVIGELDPAAVVSAPQMYSESMLIVSTKTDEFEYDDSLTLR